ncbi:hypothetical protein KBD49_05235 [Myxococcota bacterium]|nr:hypothetical protein [Myxococcota bacterium]
MLAPGSWSSDRDGPLGTGESLQGVVLSRGSHRLSYVVRDRAGQEGGAWTDVVVEELDVFDASLEDGALAIHLPDQDRARGRPGGLRSAVTPGRGGVRPTFVVRSRAGARSIVASLRKTSPCTTSVDSTLP